MTQFQEQTIGHHKAIDPSGVVNPVNNIERTEFAVRSKKFFNNNTNKTI
jgi:hypothetical protein